MPQTLRVPLADLEPVAPVQTTSTIRVPLTDLTLVPSSVSVAPRVSTPPPAAATRGMLPPSTMAGDPAPFNAPRPTRGRTTRSAGGSVPLDGVVPQIARGIARGAASIPE